MRIVLWLLFVVAAILALTSAAARRFQHRIDGEARALLAAAGSAGARPVEAHEIEKLPPPVRRWLEVSGTVGRPHATTARLEQRGEFRMGPDKPWMPVAAKQYRVASLAADRYMSVEGGSRLEKWFIPVTEWRTVRGIELPVRGNAVWKLAGGDFDYYRWEVSDVEVNHPALYADEPAPPEEATR